MPRPRKHPVVAPWGRNYVRPSWYLPYGKWTTATGREVLFDRCYCPIAGREHGKVRKAHPLERIPWVKQEWFYDDGTPEKQRHKNIAPVLAEWGYTEAEVMSRPAAYRAAAAK